MTDQSRLPGPSGDSFLERAAARLQEIDRLDAQLVSEIEERRQTRATLRQEGVELRRSIRSYAKVMGISSEAAGVERAEPGHGSIADIAYEHLRAHGGRARVVDVVKYLEETGKLAPSKRPSGENYGPVYSALLRDHARFRQGTRGEFVLAEVAEGGG